LEERGGNINKGEKKQMDIRSFLKRRNGAESEKNLDSDKKKLKF